MEHQLLGEQIPQALFLQLEIGGQSLGQGDQAKATVAVEPQGEGHRQAVGGQMGEGVVAVHHDRGEDGQHIVLKPAFRLLALLAVQLTGEQVADVAGAQPLFQLGDDLVPLFVQTRHSFEDGLKLFGGGKAALAVYMGLLGQGHIVDGTHPDHKKLVQVAGENGGEFQPFKQRNAFILGLFQHPLVEAQPG